MLGIILFLIGGFFINFTCVTIAYALDGGSGEETMSDLIASLIISAVFCFMWPFVIVLFLVVLACVWFANRAFPIWCGIVGWIRGKV